MPSNTPRQQILLNEQRLTDACGDALPPFAPALQQYVDGLLASKDSGKPASEFLPAWAVGVPPAFPAALASAYRHTRDERYARAGRAFLQQWLDQEPVEKGWKPGPGYDILTIPHRLGDTECVGWFGVLPAFLASEQFDDAFLQRILLSATVQLDHLAATVHEGRNIRMTQGDALMTQSIRLDFLPSATTWRAVGVRVLNDAFTRQFHDDGASIEGTGWYHHICAEMAFRCWRIARKMPEIGLRVEAARVARSFDYTLALVQPDGRFSVINDTTTSLPYAQSVEQVLARRSFVYAELGLPPAAPALSSHFPMIQQAFVRSSWNADADYATFDSTHRIGWHWHPARNSVQIVVKGNRVLADPGRLALSGPEFRRYATSTAGHSTINLNGWDQSDCNASLRVHRAEGYDVFEGNYGGGYWPFNGPETGPGIFAEHHRVMICARGRFYVVLDHLRNSAGESHKPALNLHWQFAPGRLHTEPAAGQAVFTAGADEATKVLMVNAMHPAGAEWVVAEGLENPVRGWVVSQGDKPVPAPALTMLWPRNEPWSTSLGTAFLPFEGTHPPRVSTRLLSDPAQHATRNVCAFALDYADGRSDEFWWVRRFEYALDQRGGFDTDAPLVVLHKAAGGTVESALVVHGTIFAPFTREAAPQRSTFVVKNPAR